MNAVELVSLLGHSSIYPGLEGLLSREGIKKRPKIGRSLDTKIFVKGQGIVLSFTFTAKNDGIKTKDEGTFIFHRFELTFIEEDKGDGRYQGLIPFGISSNDDRLTVKKKLSTLKREMPDNDSYFCENLVWTVAYEGEKMRFIQISLPNDEMRKNGIAS